MYITRSSPYNQAVDTARSGELARTFVALADTLVADFDIVELFDHLVHACTDLLSAAAAGLLLIDERSGGRPVVVASTSEETRLLEAFQVAADEGPCLDCIRTATVVTAPDLSAAIDRWPKFVPAAGEAGFTGVAAVPLRLRTDTIGGLNLFLDGDHRLDERDTQTAQALADVATIGVLQQRTTARTSLLAEQLQHALDSRVQIEQAKALLAERHGLPFSAAFEALRRHARNGNQKLHDVAAAVIAGDLDPVQVPRV